MVVHLQVTLKWVEWTSNLYLYKHYRQSILVKRIFIVMFVLLVFPAGNAASLRRDSAISLERIEGYVKGQLELGPRIPGSEGSKKFGEWLGDAVTLWDVLPQTSIYKGVNITNYLIHHPSVDFPKYLVGAHYDTRGRTTQDSDKENPVPGANDGASGVAAVLELIQHFELINATDVGFVLFDAEDQGHDGGGYGIEDWDWIVGSTFFVENNSLAIETSLESFILLDMIGNKNIKLMYEGYSDKSLREEIWDVGHSLGYENTFVKQVGDFLIDDHRPFLKAGVPSVDIIDFSGYDEWHTIKDDLDAVSMTSIGIVADVVLEYFTTLLSLTYTPDSTPQQQVFITLWAMVLPVAIGSKLRTKLKYLKS